MRTFLIALPIAFLFISSCTQNQNVMRNGDLLFCAYPSGELNKAIDEVTQTKKPTNYSHMGMVQIEAKDTFVIHASTKKGVAKEKLHDFITNENASTIAVYRVKNLTAEQIQKAVKLAESKVGLPYNYTYQLTDSAYYCSTLIYDGFSEFGTFTLDPMTFKDPVTGEFHPGWISHFKKLGREIPEGEPGCNPNGMAASKNLTFIQNLK